MTAAAGCWSCPFWHERYPDAGTGPCRRHAPSGADWWHDTLASDWCGEHPALSPTGTRVVPDADLDGVERALRLARSFVAEHGSEYDDHGAGDAVEAALSVLAVLRAVRS